MVGGRRSVKLVVATGRKLIGRACTLSKHQSDNLVLGLRLTGRGIPQESLAGGAYTMHLARRISRRGPLAGSLFGRGGFPDEGGPRA